MLGDVLSRAPHVMEDTVINNVTASIMGNTLPVKLEYENDQVFGPIVQGLKGELPTDKVQQDRVSRLLPLFKYVNGRLFYNNKMCVPRKNIRDVLYAAHDVSISGHFGFGKTMGRL